MRTAGHGETLINKLKNSQSGVGLLQVLIAFSMVAGGGFLVMKSIDESNKSIKTNMLNDAMDDYKTQISMILSSSQACVNTFGGKNARNSVAVTAVKDQAGFSVATSAMKFGTSNVSFEDIKLSDPGVATDDVNVVTNGAGTTYAKVSFQKNEKSFFKNRNQVKKIKMWVLTDASGNVTNCYSMSDASDSAWTREVPSNNINYSLGNVGIGVASPTEKLDVLGRVNTTTTAGERIGLGGTPTEYQIVTSADHPLIFRNAGGATANVIVNKAQADKNFFLKPVLTAGSSPSGVACSASLEGAMRIRRINLRNGHVGDQSALSVFRTQICSPYGGSWKWRTLKVRKYKRAGGAPCDPSLARKDCIDSRAADQ